MQVYSKEEIVFNNFVEKNDINVLLDFLNDPEESLHSVYISIFVQNLDDLIIAGGDKTFLENCILELLLLGEKFNPKYSKYIEKLLTVDESDYENYLFLISHTAFESESIRKYQTFLIDRLMKDMLDETIYQKCKALAIAEHMQIAKNIASLESTPDYGDGISAPFNYSIYFQMQNYYYACWRDDVTPVFVDLVLNELKKHTFEYKGNHYTVQDIVAFEKYGKFFVQYIASNENDTIQINVDLASWKKAE